MTMVEICMCIIIGFMFFGIITMGVLISKLGDIIDELIFMNRKVDGIMNDSIATKWRVDHTMDYTREIRDAICFDDKGNDECECNLCCEDNEEDDELDIHLITAEQYHFADGYSKNELKYYPNTDQVKYFFTDNTYLAMEDIPEYIGDGLVFFGMNVQEPNVVYVRNHILNADFRIEKIEKVVDRNG